MFPNPRREVAILVSAICMCGSAYAFSVGSLGVGGFLMGVSLWVILSCEALQLVRVHTEMASMIDKLRQKQAEDTVGIMAFLRESMITGKPFDTLAGAEKIVNSVHLPAFVLSPAFVIMKANDHMCDLLGWDSGALDGIAGHIINDVTIMSKVGAVCAAPPHAEKQFLSLRYAYLHKSGKRILGSLHIIRVANGSFLSLFHPDGDNIVSDVELKEMIAKIDGGKAGM